MIKRKKFKKTALIFAGMILSLIILELLLQITGFFYSNFFIDKPQDIVKAEGREYRILCLGDSWTVGAGLDREDSYPAQLEKILNAAHSKRKFKVYNLGFHDFNSTMVLRKFKNAYPVLNPDIVVVMMGRSEPCGSFSQARSRRPSFRRNVSGIRFGPQLRQVFQQDPPYFEHCAGMTVDLHMILGNDGFRSDIVQMRTLVGHNPISLGRYAADHLVLRESPQDIVVLDPIRSRRLQH